MKKAVLFDLDGTLVDSSEGITKSVQYALKHFGIKENDLTKLQVFIGPPLGESFVRYYGFSKEQVNEGIIAYRERYKSIGIFECEIYPGVRECITQLKERGYLIGVASSKPEKFCRMILEHFNVLSLFDDVVGATEDGSIGTKEEVLNEVMRRWTDISKEDMCLIGDTIFDVEGANLVGIPAIGVSFGFGDTDEMVRAGAKGICDRMADLPEMIEKLI